MPRFIANSFLGLNYVFSVQAGYICFNLIVLSKNKNTICLLKTEFKAKKTLYKGGTLKRVHTYIVVY